MTLLEMHQAFRFRADTINSNRTRAILPFHIDYLLNQAVLQELNEMCRTSFSDDSLDLSLETIANLGTLVTSLTDNNLVIGEYKGIRCKKIQLPSTGVVQVISANTSDTNQSLTGLNISGKVRFTNTNYLTHVLSDYLSKSQINSVVGCIDNNIIYVFEDGFVLNKIYVSYIKQPVKLDLENNPNVDCELNPRLHDKIVSNAVDTYTAIMNNPSKYQMLVNETNKL